MAVQKGKSNFAAKLGDKLKKAHDAHKDEGVILGTGGELPDGIEGGIAQLKECKIDVYKEGDNKGEFFFYAAAVVIKPKLVGDILVEGMRTTIGPEPLCDTPNAQGKKKTFDDHYAWVLNQLKIIVGEQTIKDMDHTQIEAMCDAIKDAAPYIRFRTWKGKKQTTGQYKDKEPRVMSEWKGVIEDYQQENDTETVDNTSAPEAPAPAEEKKPAPAAKAAPKAGKAKPPTTPPVEVVAPTEEEPDLDALVEAADAGDDDSIATLVGICTNAGIDPEDKEYKDLSWAELLPILKEAMGGGTTEEVTEEASESAENTSPTINKKDVFFFKPVSVKTKKKVAKGIECSVILVNEDAQTVNLKNLDDGKTIYKDVPFSELDQEA